MRITNHLSITRLKEIGNKLFMNTIHNKSIREEERDAIDAYLECTTYCSLGDQENDCKTICMERHLKSNYF